MKKAIILSVIIAGLCSIIYELLISATASYFLGDGVKQFSILIGIYLFSMGVGAYFSKFLKNQPLSFFVGVEYFLGFIGGISVPALYFLFLHTGQDGFQFSCLAIIFVIGLLTGAEVPLLAFAFEESEVKRQLPNILSLDYIGGLLATLLFPFVLLPFLGLFYSSLLFGIVNILLGFAVSYWAFGFRWKFALPAFVLLTLLIGMVVSTASLLNIWEQKIYKQPIILSEQSNYQKIVITKNGHRDVRLFLNRAIQFSSLDEHRYHELLVHIPFLYGEDIKEVLILGGGENLASREVLKHSSVKRIDVIDIDSVIFDLAKHHPDIVAINQNAANNPKVHLITDDAFRFLSYSEHRYDLIICDLPDPANESIARLYSKQFYMLVNRHLKKNGLLVTQAGEIYFSNRVFNCIKNTLASVYPHSMAYHTYVPSFGDWGFVLASNEKLVQVDAQSLPQGLKYLNKEQVLASKVFPEETLIAHAKVNELHRPIILNYYNSDWDKWKLDLSPSASGR